jgi:hypothetical protein
MITATVTINTLTGVHAFTVEITDVFTTGDGRKIAAVEALPIDGKTIRPFTESSHGGSCQTSTALIPIAFLKQVGIAVELSVNQTAEVGSL